MNGSGRPIALAGLAGAAAAALGIGVSEAIAGVIAGATSLVDAIGQVVIDLQPPGAKDFVVELFGTNDKLALEIVVTLVALALGAAFGVLAARRFLFGALGFAAFGVVGFLAALGQPLAMPAIVAVQAAAATAIAIQTLSWLLGRLMSAPSAASIPDPARRSFLLRTSAVGIGAVAAGVFGRNAIASGNSAPAPTIPLPPPAEVVPPLPAAADLSPTTAGLTPIVVPNDQFYRIDTALLVPSLDTATWQLRIHGLVDRETTLTWDQLISLPMFEQYCTIACVSNEVGGHLVGNAKWTGVRLRDVLDIAGPTSSATQLVGRSVDGWTAGMPMAWVTDPDREPMIAVEMNDEPLPRAHGYPGTSHHPGAVRLRVGHEVALGARADHVGVVRRVLGAARLVEGGPDPDAVAHRHPAREHLRPDAFRSRASRGRPTAASARSRWGSTGSGAKHSCPPPSPTRHGSSGSTRGTRPRVRTTSRSGPPTAPERSRRRSRRDRHPTGRAAGTRSPSTSPDPRGVWV